MTDRYLVELYGVRLTKKQGDLLWEALVKIQESFKFSDKITVHQKPV